MAREHRVLSLLAAAYPRAPRSLHFCDDATVIGAPFIVIERRHGVVVRDRVPRTRSPPSRCRASRRPRARRRGRRSARDRPRRARPRRARHRRQLRPPPGRGLGGALATRRARRIAAGDGRGRGRLLDHLPDAPRRSVVAQRSQARQLPVPRRRPRHRDLGVRLGHGDHRRPALRRRAAPRVDAAQSPAWVLTAEEAVERYASRSGIDVSNIDWYRAFATWRTAVVLQQLYNRYLDGDTTDPRYATFGDAIDDYVTTAATLVGL